MRLDVGLGQRINRALSMPRGDDAMIAHQQHATRAKFASQFAQGINLSWAKNNTRARLVVERDHALRINIPRG